MRVVEAGRVDDRRQGAGERAVGEEGPLLEHGRLETQRCRADARAGELRPLEHHDLVATGRRMPPRRALLAPVGRRHDAEEEDPAPSAVELYFAVAPVRHTGDGAQRPAGRAGNAHRHGLPRAREGPGREVRQARLQEEGAAFAWERCRLDRVPGDDQRTVEARSGRFELRRLESVEQIGALTGRSIDDDDPRRPGRPVEALEHDPLAVGRQARMDFVGARVDPGRERSASAGRGVDDRDVEIAGQARHLGRGEDVRARSRRGGEEGQRDDRGEATDSSHEEFVSGRTIWAQDFCRSRCAVRVTPCPPPSAPSRSA